MTNPIEFRNDGSEPDRPLVRIGAPAPAPASTPASASERSNRPASASARRLRPAVADLETRALLNADVPGVSLEVSFLDDPNGDRVVIGPAVTLQGQTAPGARVFLRTGNGARQPLSTRADGEGLFEFRVTIQPNRIHRFRALAVTGLRPNVVRAGSPVLEIRGVGDTGNAAIHVLASGLDSPRKPALGPHGRLYVAVSGPGGSDAFIQDPNGPDILGVGLTGSILEVPANGAPRGQHLRAALRGLPSSALVEDRSESVGPTDIVFTEPNVAYFLTGSPVSPAARDEVLRQPLFGRLFQYNLGRSFATPLTDFPAFEAAENPDGGDVNSNPFALVPFQGGFAVADAGANAILFVNKDGAFTRPPVVLPDISTTAPWGAPFQAQAVPTSLAVGPDGALYVGELTGFPFPAAGARVHRIAFPPGQDPEISVFRDGFTQIVDIEFDARGNLYVLQYADAPLLAGNPAASLVRVAPDGSRVTITNQLSNPAGLAIGPDGVLYVTDDAFVGGRGRVLRVTPRV